MAAEYEELLRDLHVAVEQDEGRYAVQGLHAIVEHGLHLVLMEKPC